MIHLDDEGFSTPVPLRSLPNRCPDVQSDSGIYCVVSAEPKPTFTEESLGGWFKGRNPSVEIDLLEAKWVDGEPILYIGKANSLRKRIDQFARFGRGEPIGHWGGRYLWQLADPDSLPITWKIVPDPGNAEADFVSDFVERHGVLPFANLNRPHRKGTEK